MRTRLQPFPLFENEALLEKNILRNLSYYRVESTQLVLREEVVRLSSRMKFGLVSALFCVASCAAIQHSLVWQKSEQVCHDFVFIFDCGPFTAWYPNANNQLIRVFGKNVP